MIDLVVTNFILKDVEFDEKNLERKASDLFDSWDNYVSMHSSLSDYSISLTVEEGSVKGLGKVAAAIGAVYLAIGEYGDFISGIKTLQDQAYLLSDALFDQAQTRFECVNHPGNKKRSDGEIYYLRRLFERVQRGAISPDQAMSDLQTRWGEEAQESPEFLKRLADGFANAPRFPEQLSLGDGTWADCSDIDSANRTPAPRGPVLATPEVLLTQPIRIEIVRSSKQDKKEVKLTRRQRRRRVGR